MDGSLSTIAEIAAAQRLVNARRITATLAVLTLLAAPVAHALGGHPYVTFLLAGTAAGQAVAYGLTRAGLGTAGVLLSCLALTAEHIGVVAIEGRLGPIPYIAPLAIMLVAAAAPARWLPVAFVLTLAGLAVEGSLAPWGRPEQAALVAATMFAIVVFVISVVHVRGTNRAFAIAERRDRERAVATEAARESEERHRLIADHTDDLVVLVDEEWRLLYLSPSHERLLGMDVDQALGRPLYEWIGPQDQEAAAEAFATTLREGEGHTEITIPDRHGRPRTFDSQLRRVSTDRGTLVAVVGRDVTERKDLEQRLLTSERLEALGRLAGGVAHDFNNLLTVISGGAELTRAKLEEDHPARSALRTVLEATESAGKLTRQLLTFSRRQLVVRSHLDPRRALQDERAILQRMVGKEVELVYEMPPDVPSVFMPAVHLEQLAMNLAVNARDAMPEGGRLTIGLRGRTLGNGEVDGLPAGRYLELAVSDEGTGVPDDVLPHLFDPFFTTKGEMGTGLGLATCHSIAMQAGGTITVDTVNGEGTTFRVLLPAEEGDVAPAVESERPAPVRRILLVDDERPVRETTARMLEASGHEVVTAANLTEARRVLEDRAEQVDAVLTDIVLSGERGTDLFACCRRHRPDARIVVMSGYTPEPDASEELARHGAQFLSKPFGHDQLLEAIRGG